MKATFDSLQRYPSRVAGKAPYDFGLGGFLLLVIGHQSNRKHRDSILCKLADHQPEPQPIPTNRIYKHDYLTYVRNVIIG